MEESKHDDTVSMATHIAPQSIHLEFRKNFDVGIPLRRYRPAYQSDSEYVRDPVSYTEI